MGAAGSTKAQEDAEMGHKMRHHRHHGGVVPMGAGAGGGQLEDYETESDESTLLDDLSDGESKVEQIGSLANSAGSSGGVGVAGGTGGSPRRGRKTGSGSPGKRGRAAHAGAGQEDWAKQRTRIAVENQLLELDISRLQAQLSELDGPDDAELPHQQSGLYTDRTDHSPNRKANMAGRRAPGNGNYSDSEVANEPLPVRHRKKSVMTKGGKRILGNNNNGSSSSNFSRDRTPPSQRPSVGARAGRGIGHGHGLVEHSGPTAWSSDKQQRRQPTTSSNNSHMKPEIVFSAKADAAIAPESTRNRGRDRMSQEQHPRGAHGLRQPSISPLRSDPTSAAPAPIIVRRRERLKNAVLRELNSKRRLSGEGASGNGNVGNNSNGNSALGKGGGGGGGDSDNRTDPVSAAAAAAAAVIEHGGSGTRNTVAVSQKSRENRVPQSRASKGSHRMARVSSTGAIEGAEQHRLQQKKQLQGQRQLQQEQPKLTEQPENLEPRNSLHAPRRRRPRRQQLAHDSEQQQSAPELPQPNPRLQPRVESMSEPIPVHPEADASVSPQQQQKQRQEEDQQQQQQQQQQRQRPPRRRPRERPRQQKRTPRKSPSRLEQLQQEEGGAGPDNRPWSTTLDIRFGEVEFMLRRPIRNDKDINMVLASAEAGLLFMDELDALSARLGVLRGAISRWLLPYDDNTSITDQASVLRNVLDSMPDFLRGRIKDQQVHYLVSGANNVRQLVRIKIADDNDLEAAKKALLTTVEAFKRLKGHAEEMNMSPYELLNEQRPV